MEFEHKGPALQLAAWIPAANRLGPATKVSGPPATKVSVFKTPSHRPPSVRAAMPGAIQKVTSPFPIFTRPPARAYLTHAACPWFCLCMLGLPGFIYYAFSYAGTCKQALKLRPCCYKAGHEPAPVSKIYGHILCHSSCCSLPVSHLSA